MKHNIDAPQKHTLSIMLCLVYVCHFFYAWIYVIFCNEMFKFTFMKLPFAQTYKH